MDGGVDTLEIEQGRGVAWSQDFEALLAQTIDQNTFRRFFPSKQMGKYIPLFTTFYI